MADSNWLISAGVLDAGVEFADPPPDSFCDQQPLLEVGVR